MTGIFDDPMAAARSAYLNPPPPPMEREHPKSLERWQHYKGGIYIIQCIAKHVDDQRPMVVYASPRTLQVWVRDLAEFMEILTDGSPRFEKLNQ